MVFSSVTFLFIFLPIVFVLYYLLPNLKLKNVLLIIASLIFYAFGEPVYVFLLLLSALFNYLFGLNVVGHDTKAKVCIVLAVVYNIGMLVVFKYADFLIEIINNITRLSIGSVNLTLPIGISFFTFQALSYVIDVYRNNEMRQKKFSNVVLYIFFFPQLIAGPIVKYHDIQKEINNRDASIEDISSGIRRFIYGLAKKILIANTVGYVADTIYSMNLGDVNFLAAWVGAIAYALQIYYDFSGYSDMAFGLGKMFGFHFKENFLYPYSASSIKDFWHKWHISLSTWFKEYLYIPLGGNRKGQLRTVINKVIVFFTTGLWHGANFTFIIWGLFHGLFASLEDFQIIPTNKKWWKYVGHIYTLLVVVVAFVIFRADTVSQAFTMIAAMFTGFNSSIISSVTVAHLLSPYTVFILIFGLIFALPIKNVVSNKFTSINKEGLFEVGGYVCSFVLLALCIMSLASSSFNPFIYFRF
ncbi:MAG: MBOAT family protein [Thomasclavelia sp.]|nr:MBOAT family protein [Thomasclavelia sp.]